MKKRIKYLTIIAMIISSFLFPNLILAKNILNSEISIEENISKENDIFNEISAPNLLLAQTDTEKILYERNINEKIYPASITKLLTAILVVENCELDEIVTISENAVFSVPSGYVNANLQVGEEITVEDLLYAMLIPSANDAANALAEHVGGSIESFSTMMNAKAKELGCTKSNFTNPSGLHQEEHYTATKDLYLIAKAAIKNNIIKSIIITTNYTLPETNKYTDTQLKRVFATTNYMIKKSLTKYYCDYCLGGKTGYTTEAKNCVVEYAQKDGIELIAIVMGEDASVKGKKFLDAKEMFEYAFKNYEKMQLAEKGEKYDTININNGTKETKKLDILYKENISILREKENYEQIKENIEYTKITAPIQKGDVVGKITYEHDGIKYHTELIANSDVEESKTMSNIIKILIFSLIIYIIYNFKKSKKKYKKHGKNLKKQIKKTNKKIL